MKIRFNNFWNWSKFDPSFSIFEIHYWPDGFYGPYWSCLDIIILNFGISIEKMRKE